MALFPKMVRLRGGIEVEVGSWEELDELIERYGSAEIQRSEPARQVQPRNGRAQLAPQDQTLLQLFIERGRSGVLNREIGPALGTSGRGIGPGLEQWSRRIGLVTEDSSAQPFERVNMGVNGRGYRMTELSIRAAQGMMG